MLARGHAASGALPLAQTLQLLELFRIPTSPSAFAADAAAAVGAAERLGFPVVLKTAAPDILHKTEAAGVALDLRDRLALADAYARITAACGSLVQVQAQAPVGTEVLLGMTNDAQFGPTVTVGLGGVLAEILAPHRQAGSTLQPRGGGRVARCRRQIDMFGQPDNQRAVG